MPPKGKVAPLTLALPADVLEALDEARGRLNRQQWIRKVVVERLQAEGFFGARPARKEHDYGGK